MHACRRIARRSPLPCLALLLAAVAAADSSAQAPGQPLVSIVNYYAPPVPAPTPTALIEVRLPAEAELWFDGTPMARRGPRRVFTTPPLTPGVAYTYDVAARWRRQGRDAVRGERVTLRAGEAVVVDFGPREGEPGHMAVRDVPRDVAAVPAAQVDGRGSLTELRGGRVPPRPLPDHMEVLDLNGRPAVHTAPAPPGRMSSVEFPNAPR